MITPENQGHSQEDYQNEILSARSQKSYDQNKMSLNEMKNGLSSIKMTYSKNLRSTKYLIALSCILVVII